MQQKTEKGIDHNVIPLPSKAMAFWLLVLTAAHVGFLFWVGVQ